MGIGIPLNKKEKLEILERLDMSIEDVEDAISFSKDEEELKGFLKELKFYNNLREKIEKTKRLL